MSYKKWGMAFPVILDGLSPEQVIAEAVEMGQSELIVCSMIYASYRMVLPRHPKQVYQLETGMTFFPVNDSFYDNCQIQPVNSRDFGHRDLFKETTKAAAKYEIDIAAWVSCFANGRIAKEYPESAVENLYGSKDRLFLCFNNPEVKKYVQAMFRNLVSEYPISSIMADKIPQSMLEANSFAGRIDPLLRLAGSICFCEHCMTQAKNDEIDLVEAKRILFRVAEASRKVPQYVRDALADELSGDTEAPLFLLEEPLIADVLRWRTSCVARFLNETRQMVQNIRSECKVSACLVPPVKIGHDATAPRAWLCAQTYRQFAPVVDTLHSVIHWEPEVVEYDTRRARDMVDQANPNCELCVHVSAYGRSRPEEMSLLVKAALGQGADSIAFFCHDLLDDRMIDALKAL
jgi:hypothetical protein